MSRARNPRRALEKQLRWKGQAPRDTGGGGESRAFRFIDNYGLLLCLGEGGMGEVWAARDPGAPKNLVVALKTTKRQGSEAARVLWDEARIASLIDHPNVCRVRELGRSGDAQYLVLDYCDGATLHDLVEHSIDRTLTYPLAARILANVCAGLHAAHELLDETGQHLGVIHRDVSPQNILISTAGQVTITDFGVAKALGQAHKATETGEMKGKLSYMAPEQITSRDIDRRVDVFALGCVLYQITLGRRPFHGEDALSTLYQLLEKDLTTPRELDPNYPEELEGIVLRALKKDRSERTASAEAMQRELEHFLMSTGHPVSEQDVATAMTEALGGRLASRREAIRRHVRALDAGELRSGERQSVAHPPTQIPETTAGTVTDAPPPSAKASWLAAAAVFVVIGLGTTLMLSRSTELEAGALESGGSVVDESQAPQGSVREDTSADSAGPTQTEERPRVPAPVVAADRDTASAAAEEAAPAEARQLVKVRVKVLPPEAEIEVDGVGMGKGTYEAEVKPSSSGHILRVSAPGYESTTRALVFDRSQDLELSLRRRAVTVVPRQAPSPAKTRLPSSPKTNTKPPRALDSENPFANP